MVKKIDSYDVRLKMAEMHDEYMDELSEAYGRKEYVKVTWLCYSIFEQRITRLIEKHIDYCPKGKKTKGAPAGISTRINCIKELIKHKYNGYDILNIQLFDNLSSWVKKRNDLAHGLVSLEHYKKYEEEFEKLAKDGVDLVFDLYNQITDYRNWWMNAKKLSKKFPKFKCNCKENRCIYEKNYQEN